jgi:SAM-dependent methyltransferase
MSWESILEPGPVSGATLAGSDGVAGCGFNSDRAHPARVYNRWLGGKDNFAADREVADHVARIAPWAATGARANRSFLRRAVSFLAAEGISQFLDVGAGLPSAGNVHEVAQRLQPDARVCYLDNDPVVLAHARALLAGQTTIAVAGDARDPHAILADPAVRAHIDFQRPAAVLFVAILHFLRATDDPAGVVAAFRDALAPGSFVVISHVADLPDDPTDPERAEATREAVKAYEDLAAPFVLRSRQEIAGLFAGFDLVEPGVVGAHQWRPQRGRPGLPVPVLAGVGQLQATGPRPVAGTPLTRLGDDDAAN